MTFSVVAFDLVMQQMSMTRTSINISDLFVSQISKLQEATSKRETSLSDLWTVLVT